MSHGSSCSGIIAGQSSAKGWQTGIAPDSRLLLLKGGFDLRSMEYLLLNGADLVSMSYMIVGRDLGQIRGLFRNAFEHLSLGGVLAVGGAGNYGPKSRRAMPQGKQIGLPKDIPSVLAVAGVDQKRVPLPFSSQGPCFWEGVKFFSDYPKDKPLGKPDLTAFPTGYPVWSLSLIVTGSHRLRPGWKEVSKDQGASLIVGPAGNSFPALTPSCSLLGVAALVFSANESPAINPWEVSEILQDLEPRRTLGNPQWIRSHRDTLFVYFGCGAGLIDALAAVRAMPRRKGLVLQALEDVLGYDFGQGLRTVREIMRNQYARSFFLFLALHLLPQIIIKY